MHLKERSALYIMANGYVHCKPLLDIIKSQEDQARD